MAAILKRNGQYYAQFYDESRSPKRKRFSLKATRKRDARRRLGKFEDDYHDGKFDPWVDDPWSYDQEEVTPKAIQDALDHFLARKQKEDRSENTLRTYRGSSGFSCQRWEKRPSWTGSPPRSFETSSGTRHWRKRRSESDTGIFAPSSGGA